MKQNEPPIDPPDDGYFDDEEREKAERRKDEEDDAAYDRWRETVGGKDTLPKNAEDVVYQVWQVVSGDGSCYVVNQEPIAIAIVEEYVHNMTDQIQKEKDALYAEVARLRDGMVSDKEWLAMYGDEIAKLRGEIAKLRAERKELIQAGNTMRAFILEWRDCLDGVQMTEEGFVCDCGIGRWNRAQAEKGE